MGLIKETENMRFKNWDMLGYVKCIRYKSLEESQGRTMKIIKLMFWV